MLLAALVLLAGAVGAPGASRSECAEACRVAIEGCIAWRGTALRDLDAPVGKIRRAARRIRRSCRKSAVRTCRSEGVGACAAPTFCACGRGG